MRLSLECFALRCGRVLLLSRSERGLAGSVTHLDVLVNQRLEMLLIQLSPVFLYLMDMLYGAACPVILTIAGLRRI
jgi:hypothetical protein